MLPRPQTRQTPIPVNARFAASRCVNLQEEPRDTRRLDYKTPATLDPLLYFQFTPSLDSSSEKNAGIQGSWERGFHSDM